MPFIAADMPPPTPPAAISEASPSMTNFVHTRLVLPTGVELDVLQSGDPTGVPLLLLHGISDSAPSMRPLMSALPSGIRAIAVTQRGHGDSSKPLGPYSTEAFAADAAAALDRLGVRRAVVLGHSMGSLVAQRFALDHPERTAGLILVGAFPTLSGNPAVQPFYDELVAPLQGHMDPATARAFQESTLARPVPSEFLDLVTRETGKLPAHAWKGILTSMMAEDLTARLGSVAAPTLILWGDKDAFALETDQQRLKASIPGARLAVFHDTGHSPHWEEPERAARLVADFVAHGRAQPQAAEVGR